MPASLSNAVSPVTETDVAAATHFPRRLDQYAPSRRAGRSSAHPPLCRQFGFLTRDGRLVPENMRMDPQIPIESLDEAASSLAIRSEEAVIRPGVDDRSRTILLTYVPGPPPRAGHPDARVSAVFLISLLHMGEALRRRARELGMSNLGARICVSLVENGSLRKASEACGISYQTARSEISEAMQVTGAKNQCALIHCLADDWLPYPFDGKRAIELLMSTFDLTLREAQMAALLAQGHRRPEVARKLGVSQWSVKSGCAHVFAALGVAKAPEITRVVIDLILAADVADRHQRATMAERAAA